MFKQCLFFVFLASSAVAEPVMTVDELVEFSKVMNTRLPMMLNEDVRWDSYTFHKDRTGIRELTVLSDSAWDQMKGNIENTAQESYCESDFTRTNLVKSIFVYKKYNGEKLGSTISLQSNCGKMEDGHVNN